MSRKAFAVVAVLLAVMAAGGYAAWRVWFAPTRVLVVNALPAQEAELKLSADPAVVTLTSVAMEDAGGFDGYDAVLLYGRGLYLDSLQRESLGRAARKGWLSTPTHSGSHRLWLRGISIPHRWPLLTAISATSAGPITGTCSVISGQWLHRAGCADRDGNHRWNSPTECSITLTKAIISPPVTNLTGISGTRGSIMRVG